jgi:hypothetical protein
MPLCFLCVLHLLTFPPGWTAHVVKPFVIFIQVGTYLYIYTHIKHADLTPCIFLPLNLYHPGIGDLNLPVLQHWWLEFNFMVVIHIYIAKNETRLARPAHVPS